MSVTGAHPLDQAPSTFEEPWQARLFAMTQGVIESGGIDREGFRQRLIAAIEALPQRPYWESWLAAFDDALLAAGPTD